MNSNWIELACFGSNPNNGIISSWKCWPLVEGQELFPKRGGVTCIRKYSRGLTSIPDYFPNQLNYSVTLPLIIICGGFVFLFTLSIRSSGGIFQENMGHLNVSNLNTSSYGPATCPRYALLSFPSLFIFHV